MFRVPTLVGCPRKETSIKRQYPEHSSSRGGGGALDHELDPAVDHHFFD